MTSLSAWLIAGSYPAVLMLIPNRVAGRWGAKYHGKIPMPPDVQSRAVRNGRFLLLAKCIVILALFWILDTRLPEIAPRIIPPWARVGTFVILGVALGLMLGIARSRTALWLHARNPPRFAPGYLSGPLLLWFAIFCVASFLEELWRASSLVALRSAGWENASSIVITSAFFSLGYLSGLPARQSDGLTDLILTSSWGAALGILFLFSGSILAPTIANLTCNTCDMLIRRKALSTL
jgi:hypothetical protein